MARKGAALIAAGILAAFAGGLLLGRAIAPGSGSTNQPNSQQIVAAEKRGETDRLRLPFQRRRADNAERPQQEISKDFAYRRLILDTGADLPKACFQFTRDLDDSGKTNYADFVRLTPDTGAAVEVNGSSLCLTGLAFDKDYRARLRAGLPDKKGDKLERAEEVVVAFGDKPAYVGFAGDGVILPRLEADGVGIETVNVDKIEIAVYRVSDRALARKEIVAGEASGEDSYSYVWSVKTARMWASRSSKVKLKRRETAMRRRPASSPSAPRSANLRPALILFALRMFLRGRMIGAWRRLGAGSCSLIWRLRPIQVRTALMFLSDQLRPRAR